MNLAPAMSRCMGAVLLSGAALHVQAAPAGGLAHLPLQRPASEESGMVLRAALGLGLVLAGAAAVGWRVRRHGRHGAQKSDAVLVRTAALRLSAHAALHVVRFGGEELLLAEQGGAVVLLTRHPAPSGERP